MQRPSLEDQIRDYAVTADVAKDARSTRDEFRRLDARIAELEPAYALLKRIAEKAVEPMSESADPNKTLGQIRSEMVPLLQEAVSFFMAREQPTDDWHYQHGWDEHG